MGELGDSLEEGDAALLLQSCWNGNSGSKTHKVPWHRGTEAHARGEAAGFSVATR